MNTRKITVTLTICIFLECFFSGSTLGYVPKTEEQKALAGDPNIPTQVDVAVELVKLLCEKHNQTSTAIIVCDTLKEIGELAVNPLVNTLKTTSISNVRFFIIRILGDIGSNTRSVTSEVVKNLTHRHPNVQTEAVKTLEKLNYKPTENEIQDLIKILHSTHQNNTVADYLRKSLAGLGKDVVVALNSELNKISKKLYWFSVNRTNPLHS